MLLLLHNKNISDFFNEMDIISETFYDRKVSSNVRERIVAGSVISPGPLFVFVFINRWRNYGPGDYTVTHVTCPKQSRLV